MSACPKCGKDIEGEHFGLVQCPACEAMLVVDLSGELKISTDGESLQPPVFPSASEPMAAHEELVGPSETELGAEEEIANQELTGWNIEPGISIPDEKPLENLASLDLGTQASDEPLGFEEPTPVESMSGGDIEFHNSVVTDVVDILEDQESGDELGGAPEDPLGEIEEFGNSEVSAGREGLVNYLLTVEGIDTLDLKKQVHDILKDRKYQIDHDQVMAKIINGKISILKLNPVKCSLIVTRLKELPVKIFWKQFSIVEQGGHNEPIP